MTKPKVVLDTNVYISAVFWKGPPHKIFKKALEGQFIILISQPILDELSQKLTQKFEVPKLVADLLETLILSNSKFVESTNTLEEIEADPSDNKILECAAEEADYIVSGDSHLLEVDQYQEVEIINPKEFLIKLNSR